MNSFKRLTSILLAVLMLVSVMTVAVTSVSAAGVIKFTDNHGWGENGKIYAYFFDGTNTVGAAWPGTEMGNPENNGMGQKNYSVAIPDGATYVIFNNKNDQTEDIQLGGYEGYYTTEEMTKNNDGKDVYVAFGWNTTPNTPDTPDTPAVTSAPSADGVSVTFASKQNLFAPVTKTYSKGETFTVEYLLNVTTARVMCLQMENQFNSNSLLVTGSTQPVGMPNNKPEVQASDNAVLFNIMSGETGEDFLTEKTLIKYTVQVKDTASAAETMTLDMKIIDAMGEDEYAEPVEVVTKKNGVVRPGEVSMKCIPSEPVAATTAPADTTVPTTKPTEPTTAPSNDVKVILNSKQNLFAPVERTYKVGDTFTVEYFLTVKNSNVMCLQMEAQFDSNALLVTGSTQPVGLANNKPEIQASENAVLFNIMSGETGENFQTEKTLIKYTVQVKDVPGTTQNFTLDMKIVDAMGADVSDDAVEIVTRKGGVVKPELITVRLEASESTPTTEPSEPATTPTTAPTTATEPTTVPTTAPTTATEPTTKATEPTEPTTAPTTATEPTTAPTTAEDTTVPTTAPTTAEDTTVPTTAPTTVEDTTAPTTAEDTTEPTTAAPEMATYHYYFAPLASDVEAGCVFKANICGEDGNWFPYEMTATGKTFNGRAVYVAEITVPADAKLSTLQYQVYTADGNWAHQIELAGLVPYSTYDGIIMVANTESAGSSETFVEDQTTTAPTTAEDTTEPTTAEPTTEPTTAPTTAPATTAPATQPTTAKLPSITSVDNTIKKTNTDKADVKGSTFAKLKLKETPTSKTSIRLNWTKVSGAKGYIIYGALCGKTIKKLKTIKNAKTVKYTFKKLKKGKYYKYMVVAYNSKNKVIATSKVTHATTKGGKYGNATKVVYSKSKITIKKGKTFTIKGIKFKYDKKIKNHVKTRFESSKTSVAKVTSKGKITAKKKGTCYIYIYAQNGYYKKVKVTVK